MTGNKSITANFAAVGSLPDYQIQTSSWPANAAAGQIIGGSVAVTIENAGAADPYPGEILVGIYLSADPVITKGDIPLW
jgi:hypothetical protein